MRALAIVERDLRKFLRSPALMMVAMIFPLVQLVVLGNAFGGNLKNIRMAVVDQDRGPAALAVMERLQAVAANARTFIPMRYLTQADALHDLRQADVQAVLLIPPQYSRDYYAHQAPQLGLVVDNTDRFVSSALGGVMSALVESLNVPEVLPRQPQQVALDVVELYPYIDYMKYLLPGSITLAIFVTAMIGGGIVYIDDKARGLHEGYLVTPISKVELIAGLNLAGVIKGVLAGMVISVLGSLISGVPAFYLPQRLLGLLLMTVVTAAALIGMMFLLMVRVSDPLVPRATFGVLNTLLFFPSGAIYPIQAFPRWLRAIAVVDPFTYAVHGYKNVLLKQSGFAALAGDVTFLALFSLVMLTCATLLFKRTL